MSNCSAVKLFLKPWVPIIALMAMPLHADGQKAEASPTVVPQWVTAAGGKKAFDIASVKQNKSSDPRQHANMPMGPGDVYSPTGGVFSAKNIPLMQYVAFAYKVTNNQWDALDKQMPEWAHTDRYDIEARSDDHNATKDQMRLMVQALLAERFKLAMHIEARQVSVYALELVKPGKTGPMLVPRPADAACSTAPTDEGSGKFPIPCGGILGMPPTTPGDDRVGARNIKIDLIASFLSGIGEGTNKPVLDETGLSGKYDFSLEWANEPENAAQAGASGSPALEGPSIIEALKEQLGLKLVSAKGPVETVVVEHVERASEN
jgi:uncharacterized protein (TIGR03435 family)